MAIFLGGVVHPNPRRSGPSSGFLGSANSIGVSALEVGLGGVEGEEPTTPAGTSHPMRVVTSVRIDLWRCPELGEEFDPQSDLQVEPWLKGACADGQFF